MRGGLIFVFTVSAIFFLLGVGLVLAWIRADPRFFLGDTVPPPDTTELESAEALLHGQIADCDRLILRLKQNLDDLPVDAPAAQRAGYEKRLGDTEGLRKEAADGLIQLDERRDELRTHHGERLQKARTHTLTRGIFLLFIGLVGMVRFREAITRRSIE